MGEEKAGGRVQMRLEWWANKHPIAEAPYALGFCQPLPTTFQSLPEKPKGTAGRKEAKTRQGPQIHPIEAAPSKKYRGTHLQNFWCSEYVNILDKPYNFYKYQMQLFHTYI